MTEKQNQNKSPYAVFETDKELETKGRWVDFGVAGEYLIARAGGANQKYRRLLTARMKKIKGMKGPMGGLTDPDELAVQLGEDRAQEIMVETFVDAILLDWKEVNARNGQPLEFNRDNAIKLMTDLPKLFEELQKMALNFAVFRRYEVERDVKK